MLKNKILLSEEAIAEYLQIANPREHQYLVGRTSQICLGKFVELVFNNKYHEPLKLFPFQLVLLNMLWNKKFPMVLASRGAGKTFILALYALLKCLLEPGSRIVIVSGGFRQAKFVMMYVEELMKNSPIISETIYKYHTGNDFGVKFATDKVYLKVGPNTEISALPLGNGQRVRGMRASVLMVDETASVDEKVFDEAIAPFLAAAANPAEAVLVTGFVDKLYKMGASDNVIELIENSRSIKSNQLVLAGTATYQFSHFYKRYQVYNIFAKSGGDRQKIKEGLQIQAGDPKIPISDKMLDIWSRLYKEYAIFQLPYYGMPPGFLDEAMIATHKATMSSIVFGQEYECRFSKDTHGFFPRSMIDEASPGLKAAEAGEQEVHYEMYGDPSARYVMGLDPARHNDNFGLVILKLENGRAHSVYVDAWNKADWSKSVKKIREVIRRFPTIVHIAIDAGGGGTTVRDLLANAQMLKEGDRPIIEFEPPDEFKSIPNAVRMIEMVNFNNWVAPANHALKSDIGLKKLLFPGRVDDDAILLRHGLILKGAPFDIEDPNDVKVIDHINDLLYGTESSSGDVLTIGNYKQHMAMIDEVCAIVQTVTEKGTESFGLPKLSDQLEGLDVRRRDRYSALLLASHAARQVLGHGYEKIHRALGGTPNMILGGAPHRVNGAGQMRRKGGVIY